MTTKSMKKLFALLVFLPLFSNAQIINTFAGNAANYYGGDGGPATAGLLYQPTGIAVDAAGNKYIADHLNNRIRMVSATGIITTIAGNSIIGYGGDGGPATAAQLNAPYGVAVDASGNVYFADMYNDCVRMINASGTITSVAGSFFTGGYSGDGGPATAAGLYNPVAVAIDASGNLYIADQGNEVIRKVDASGTITTFAGSSGGYSGDGGPATDAQLNNPAGVAVDASGNVYIADEFNARIRKVNAAGIITTIAGNGTLGFSGDSGPATLAELYEPAGVSIDATGNMYIADMINNRIRKVNTMGIITTAGGDGISGFAGDGGAAIAAKMYFPSAVTTDATGNIFIADESNNRIREINTSGIISTIAGSGVAAYGDGGPATAAQLNQPEDVVSDAFGNLYISDYGHSLIRKVDTAGIITTIAGNGIVGYTGD
jgi:sugar lactone lactonase YvrE